MANKWFKFYGGEYLSDPKIERLSPLERSCWITLLCMASMGEDGEIEFLTVESLLNRSGIQFDPYHPEEWERALSVLVKFTKLKMISTSEEGLITILNWEKRQEHNLTVAERVAKSRKNKADVTTNVTNVTTDKNRIDKNILSAEESAQEPIIEEKGDGEVPIPRPVSKKKYPHAKEIFVLFPNPQASWQIDTTQCKHAETLFLKGVSNVKAAIQLYEENKDTQYIPKARTPFELSTKWLALLDFKKENGL